MKKSIAFYCCSNGLGHYKRVSEIAKHLIDHYKVTIFCTSKHLVKLGPVKKVNYRLTDKNIDWRLVGQGKTDQAIDLYFKWVKTYGRTTKEFDIVVSDNLPGLLEYNPNTILMGSFLWKDVFYSELGSNRLSTYDKKLINKHSPVIITNKYVETQSVKEYHNKKQFGFGCKDRRLIFSDIRYNLVNTSSLDYLPTYNAFIEKTKVDNKLAFVEDFSYIDNTIMFARPGVGTITHCVENCIPLVALYDDNDSQEIIELAQVVEDLHLGFKQNVNELLDTTKLKIWRSNSNILYGPKLDLEAYKNIAEYLKQL